MKKKYLLLSAFVLGFIPSSFSQGYQIGGSLGVQFPMGSFGEYYNMGLGLTLSGRYELKHGMRVGANIGYHRMGVHGDEGFVRIIPVSGVFEYHFGKGKIRPFLGAEMGFYSLTMVEISKFLGKTDKDKETRVDLGFSPSFGVAYELNKDLSIFSTIKYNHIFTPVEATSWFGLNVGVSYKL